MHQRSFAPGWRHSLSLSAAFFQFVLQSNGAALAEKLKVKRKKKPFAHFKLPSEL
jgi:hypothetical protein